jgi:predicted solute-binding protein
LTGKPFVHALLAVNSSRDLTREVEVLREAQGIGEAQLATIAREAAREMGLSHQVCLDYLRHRIRYRLGADELEGLRRFYTLCSKHGLIEGEVAIHLYPA